MVQAQSVTEILGGVEAIGRKVKTDLELAAVIRIGFWPTVIDQLFDGEILSRSDIDRLVMPRRTLNHRIKKGERLTRDESDRVARIARIIALTNDTFGDHQKAVTWLQKKQRGFAGQTAIELLDTEEGARVIEDRLNRIAHGLAA